MRRSLRFAAALVLLAGALALAYAGVVNAPPPRGEAAHLGLPNFDRVSPLLFRGAQPEPKGFETLADWGVKTVVNLRHDHADEIPTNAPLRTIRIPMEADEPSVADLKAFLRIVTAPTNQPVYVHCRRGADRTGFMVAGYRMVVEGWPRDKAIDEMMHGGYAFFPGYTQITDALKALDPDALRTELGIPRPAQP